jgi:hypothetical protein
MHLEDMMIDEAAIGVTAIVDHKEAEIVDMATDAAVAEEADVTIEGEDNHGAQNN